MSGGNTNTTLVFGVRTDAAVQQVRLLSRELTALKARLPELAASVATSSRTLDSTVTSATRSTSKGVQDAVKTVEDATPKVRAAYTQTMNGVRVSMSQMVDATNSGLTDITRKMEDFAKNPALARSIEERNRANMASQARYMQQETKRVEDAARLRVREQREQAAYRANQLRLEDAYYMRSETQRIRHLERLHLLQARGRSTEYLATRYGATVVADIPRLGELRAAEAAQRDLNRRVGEGTDRANRHRDATRANTLGMRDAHSAARGLAGSLNMLWLTWGNVAAISAGASLGGLARGTYQVGRDLEYRLKFTEALGNNPVTVDNLMPSVLGSMKTPLEAAEGLQALAQAGLSSDRALQALSGTMQLSTLGELSMADAAFAVTGALAAFNMEANQASRVGDVFTKAASVSNTTVSGIVASMRQASAAAADYGMSVEEVSGALAIMAQRNITGSMAGTAFRNMAKELYTPIARGAEAMEALGVSAYDSENRMKPLGKILQELQRELVGLDQASRNRVMEAIFGERGARSARPILADLRAYLDQVAELGEAQGYLADASSKLVDTVEGAQNRMQSTMQQAFVQSFAQVEPQIRSTLNTLDGMFASSGFLTTVTGISQAIARMTQTFAENALLITSVGGAYVTLRIAIAAGASAARAAASVQEALNAVRTRSIGVLHLETLAINTNHVALSSAAGASSRLTTAKAGLSGRTATVVGALARVSGVAGVVITAYLGISAAVSTLWATFGLGPAAFKSQEDQFAEHLALVQRQMASVQSAYEIQQTASVHGLSAREEELEARMADNVATRDKLEARVAELRRELGAKTVGDIQTLNEMRERHIGSVGELAIWAAEGISNYFVPIEATEHAEKVREITESLEKLEELDRRIVVDVHSTWTVEEIRKQAVAQEERLTLDSRRSDIANRIQGLAAEEEWTRGALSEYLGKQDLSGLLERVRGAQTIEELEKYQKEAQGILAAADKLRGTIDLGSGSGGSGSLEFRSNVSNLMQQFRNQDQLLSARRDIELRAIKDLREVGGHTADEAASMRADVWNRYLDQTLTNAAETEQRIRAIDKGSPELKELSVEKLIEDAEQARRQSIAQQENDDFQQRIQDQVNARKLLIKTAKDQEKAELGLSERVREAALTYERAYMSQEQLIASEGAELATDAYRKLIDDRRASLAELEEKYGPVEAHNMQVYQDTVEIIDALEKELAVRKEITAEKLLELYADNNTVEAGLRRGFRTYQNEVSKIGDQAANSINNSFKALEDGITGVFRNGRFEANAFFDTLGNEMARFLARNAMNTIFGESAGGSGGGLLGGIVKAGLNLIPGLSGNSMPVNAVDTGMNLGSFPVGHSGGIIGGRTRTSRVAQSAIFSGAPRMHSGGVAAGEVPIIAQRGEGIFTPEQMASLAPSGGSPTIVVNQTVNVDARADRASIIQGMQFAKADTINTIAEQFSRDGMMRRVAT